MSIPTDAVFEIPEDGGNDGPRPQEGQGQEAFVDEDNVPHPHRDDTTSMHGDAEQEPPAAGAER